MAEETKKREFRADSTRGKINALYEAITTKKTLEDVMKEMAFESDFKITKNHLKFLVSNLEFISGADLPDQLTDEEKAKLKKSFGKKFLELVTVEEAQEVVASAVTELRTLKGEVVEKVKRQYTKRKKTGKKK